MRTERQDIEIMVARGENVVTRPDRWGQRRSYGVPGDFLTFDFSPYLVEWARPYELTAAEARALAAELLRLAAEVEADAPAS